MAELYTETQLGDLRLPGFRQEADLETSLSDGTDWQTVLSLTIVTQTDEGLKILDGIRREDTNLTHPGIVSTPTGRLPRKFARMLLEEKSTSIKMANGQCWQVDTVDPQRPMIVAQLEANLDPIPDHEACLPFVAGALLAGKLGCASLLESASSSHPIGTVSLETILAGFSYVYDDVEKQEPLFEPLIMLGAVVNLFDPSFIKSTTEAYRMNSWVNLDDYRDGHANKDASLMIPEITPEDEAGVCVRGLCLATSSANIDDPILLEKHITI